MPDPNDSSSVNNMISALEANEQNAVVLRPVAITDLSIKYARKMGENKVRHYRLSSSYMIMQKMSVMDSKKIVSDYIKEKEGLNVVFEETNRPETEVKKSGLLQVSDVTSEVLEDDKDILKSLLKVKVKSLLYQFDDYPTLFHKWYFKLLYKWNNFTGWINYKLKKDFFNPYARLTPASYHKCYPVRFISIAYGDDEYKGRNEREAFYQLRNDLRILQDKKLIKGHLAMPSTVDLADIVGVGTKFKVVFCFFVVNEDRLMELTNNTPMTLPSKPLALLGVKHESNEGDANWLNDSPPEKMYQIEVVDILPISRDEVHEAYVKSYQESIPLANAAANGARKLLKNTKKISESVTVGEMVEDYGGKKRFNAKEVHVKVKLKKSKKRKR